MHYTRLMVICCVFAILTGLGARRDECCTVSGEGFVSINCVEPVQAVAAPEGSRMDSAFTPAEQAYEVNLPIVISLFMAHEKNKVHFIDARDPKLYAAGHIPGAINIPFEMLDQFSDSIKQFPKSDLQVLYCDGGDCHLSHDLAEYMLSQDWRRLAVYTGGWAEWSKETDFIETAN